VINKIFQDFAIATASDVGIVDRQQHDWYIVTDIKTSWEGQQYE